MGSTTSTWLPAAGAVLGVAVVAVFAVAVGMAKVEPRAIAQDPSEVAPQPVVVQVEVAPVSQHVGMLTPRVASDPLQRPRKTPAPAKLDSEDPWTGEDLAPQLALAAVARPRLEIDRTDAWDPSIRYEARPGLGDPALDNGDPWQRTASSKDSAPRAVAQKSGARTLDDADPWSAGAAGAVMIAAPSAAAPRL